MLCFETLLALLWFSLFDCIIIINGLIFIIQTFQYLTSHKTSKSFIAVSHSLNSFQQIWILLQDYFYQLNFLITLSNPHINPINYWIIKSRFLWLLLLLSIEAFNVWKLLRIFLSYLHSWSNHKRFICI